MSKKDKGTETKNKLLECSRKLFYQYGYHNTTTRMIASESQLNLGLFHYYFNGKIEIGMTAYYDIRIAFDHYVADYNLAKNEVDVFIFSSAIELYLCLTYPSYGQFFFDLSAEPKVHDRTLAHIIRTFETYAKYKDPSFPVLAGISISAVKPAIVNYALQNPQKIANETYLDYYIRQQLHFFGTDEAKACDYLEILNQYIIGVDEKFTPIFYPKPSS